MKKLVLIAFSVLLLIPIVAQNAFACSTHGGPGDIILDWEVTPGSALGEFDIRFKNFNTFAYSPSEMCSCALQILSGWNIQSAKIVLSGTNTQVATFPTFLPDATLSSELESLFPTSPDKQWIALKNTITTSSAGGQSVDLVFSGIFPGQTQSDIEQALLGSLVTVGKVNVAGTGFEEGHFEALTILSQIIGGNIIPIEATSLLLVGVQSSFALILPVILVGAGFAAYKLRIQNKIN